MRIAWGPLMRLGLHDLGLQPAVFWALTPAELTLLAGGHPGASPAVGRARLEELAALYPDDDGGSDGS